VLSWLENSPFSVWAKGSSLLGGPSLLTIHVLGTALVIGLIFIIHLRLLGVFDSIAYTSLRRLFPALWVGFVVQLLSGAALWVTKATQYAIDLAFVLKLVLVVAGFILMLILYGAVKQKAVSWAADTAPVPRRFTFIVPSLLVWCVIVILSRLTAFLGALPGATVIASAPPPVPQQVDQLRNERREAEEARERAAREAEARREQAAREAREREAREAEARREQEAREAGEREAREAEAKEREAREAREREARLVVQVPAPLRLDQVRNERKEVHEGNRTVIQEANRTIIREGGHEIIRHDPVDRFRVTAKEVNVEHRDNLTITLALQADGSRIVTEVDENGRLIRRIRRDDMGNEVILIDNSSAPRGSDIAGSIVQLPPPVIQIARELYIRDAGGATAEDIALTLMAPPVERIERRYALDEILYSEPLRARMPRVDINTVNFGSGSWEITSDQADHLALIAQGILEAVKKNPAEMFLVEGYTDAVGNDVDNLSLSDRRAESVAVMLTNQFAVPAGNLTTQGYGKQFLKVQTDGPERANRRVAVRRITPLLNGGQN
jgi:OmpA-OmpF porin, OOP family